MKTNYAKSSVLLLIVLAAFTAGAQTKTSPKTADNHSLRMMNDMTTDKDGKRIEKVQAEMNAKRYKMTLVDEKMTELYVDGEKIPATDWNKYSNALTGIRQEMKEQAKRNAEQAVRNRDQAKRNAEQAVRNQEQVKRNAEQAQLNVAQEKKNDEQAVRNREQEKRNAEQGQRNDLQAKKNEEQAQRNELQAKKNDEQAKANAQMIKEITEDLVSDKIIPDVNGLRELRLSEYGMTVNGVKQSDDVFKKYKEKYSKFFDGNFNYSRDGVVRGQ
jgi:colicin import membrane protein